MSIPSPGQHPASNIQHPDHHLPGRQPANSVWPGDSILGSRLSTLGQYQDQQIDRQMYASASSQAAKVLEDHRAEEMALPWARQMQYRIKMYLKDAGTLTESKF